MSAIVLIHPTGRVVGSDLNRFHIDLAKIFLRDPAMNGDVFLAVLSRNDFATGSQISQQFPVAYVGHDVHISEMSRQCIADDTVKIFKPGL